jgi:NAD-dependent SIR2 family protein deacetylase
MEEIERLLFEDMSAPPRVPRCLKCNGLVKPAITFFGENLPAKVWFLLLLQIVFLVFDAFKLVFQQFARACECRGVACARHLSCRLRKTTKNRN